MNYTPIASGQYAALGFDANGCGAPLSNCVTVNLIGTNQNDKPSVQRYPNPVTQALHFSGIDGAVSYRIYNMLGQELMAGMTDGNAIQVSSLAAGTYLVALSSPTGTEVKRFVKE